jgi:hypothetical protein
VRCCGGGDEPEAVDVALQRAIKEPQLSRVILIGDAPPHSAPRDCTQEAESLANGNIPVFSVVVGSSVDAASSFSRIASITGGQCVSLERADELFELITLVFVSDFGSNALVNYVKAHPLLSTSGRNLLRLLKG